MDLEVLVVDDTLNDRIHRLNSVNLWKRHAQAYKERQEGKSKTIMEHE